MIIMTMMVMMAKCAHFCLSTFVFIFPRIAKWMNTFASACACSTSGFLALLGVLLNHFLVCDTLSEIYLFFVDGFAFFFFAGLFSFFFVTQLHDTSTVNNLLGRCRECFALFILSWSPHLLHSAFFLFKQFFFVPVSWGLSWFDYVKWIFCWFTFKMIARATVDTELCTTLSLSYWVCGQFISSLCVKNTFKSDILY